MDTAILAVGLVPFDVDEIDSHITSMAVGQMEKNGTTVYSPGIKALSNQSQNASIIPITTLSIEDLEQTRSSFHKMIDSIFDDFKERINEKKEGSVSGS